MRNAPRGGGALQKTAGQVVPGSVAPAAHTTAHVLAGAPCRRRSLWLVVVPRCPYCGNLHSHRSGPARLFAGEAVRTCPQTGRPYRLTVGGGRG